jgi:hypothetical protein
MCVCVCVYIYIYICSVSVITYRVMLLKDEAAAAKFVEKKIAEKEKGGYKKA